MVIAFSLRPLFLYTAIFRFRNRLRYRTGPVLEQEQVPIGVVTSIVGMAELTVVLEGSVGHAGTIPMSLGRDPMLTASRIVLGVNQIACGSRSGSVATVGSRFLTAH